MPGEEGPPGEDRVSREGGAGHPAEDAQAVLGRGEDSDRPGGAPGARRASRRCVAAKGSIPNLYYRWSKEFLEAGKRRLIGDHNPRGHLR